MASGLVDSSVVVDLLRKYAPAEVWLGTQDQLAVSRDVYFEILEGVTHKAALWEALKLLRRFELVEYTQADLEWATNNLTRFWLSHHIDGYDCLIAAPSHRPQLPLYTRNLKHFAPLLAELAQEPYS